MDTRFITVYVGGGGERRKKGKREYTRRRLAPRISTRGNDCGSRGSLERKHRVRSCAPERFDLFPLSVEYLLLLFVRERVAYCESFPCAAARASARNRASFREPPQTPGSCKVRRNESEMLNFRRKPRSSCREEEPHEASV